MRTILIVAGYMNPDITKHFSIQGYTDVSQVLGDLEYTKQQVLKMMPNQSVPFDTDAFLDELNRSKKPKEGDDKTT